MSKLSCTLEDVLRRCQTNIPTELTDIFDATKKAVAKMIDKEKEVENLQLFDHLIEHSDTRLEEKETKVEAEKVIEKQDTHVEESETFSNDIPVYGLFPITDSEWNSIPQRNKGRLTLDLVNGFIKIIDELLAKKDDFEARYFKLSKQDKDKVLHWREYETKDLVDRKWIFQDDIIEMLPQKDKYQFLKYGTDCLRYCKKIEQTRRKGKVLIVAQRYD